MTFLNRIKRKVLPGVVPSLPIHRLRDFEDYLAYQQHEKDSLAEHWAVLQKITPADQSSFPFDGYSYTARKQVSFLVDFQHSGESGKVIWRERVCCPVTGFNNRMRATIHFFDLEMDCRKNSAIYITEQITPIYQYFSRHYSNVTGSEFLGEEVPYGQLNRDGIRNETLCCLKFDDEIFDIVISLDVLEHVPDYKIAFSECGRILKKGGRLLWSVPFSPDTLRNIVCAEVINGKIHHHQPPQYHGDPLSNEGILCFTIFGWEMLEQFREAGFSDAYAIAYHSLEFGYLGGTQFLFVAKK